MSTDLFLRLPQPFFQLRHFPVQAFGKMAAEPGKVLTDQWYFLKPALYVDAEQLGDICRRQVEPLGVEIRGRGKPANRRIHSVRFAIAALEDPFQHAAVLAVSGPEEFTVL